jgi:hypothetical protein
VKSAEFRNSATIGLFLTGRVARRTMPGDDGNQMMADGNSFPIFILGWTIGAIGV